MLPGVRVVRNKFSSSIFGRSAPICEMSEFRQHTGGRQPDLFHDRLGQWIAVLATLLLHTGPGHAQSVNRFTPLRSADRIAIVAPHPDDEVLGTSGLIQQALTVGAQVKVIYLTNGDHNQAAFRRYSQRQNLPANNPLSLGERRRTEAVSAMQLLGLTTNDLVFLGYPDWWTLRLWQDYWEEENGALYNNATGSTDVPYSGDYSYHHPYRAHCVTADLCAVLREFKPTRVIVTHPCDTNPDHRAAANFVQLALLQLDPEKIRPTLDFFIVHFGNWPTPFQFCPTVRLEPPASLRADNDWSSLPLTRQQVHRKHQATLSNLTQIATEAHFLEAFTRANEVFAASREPVIPQLTAQAELDWTKATHLRALSVLPSECGHDPTGIAALPAAAAARDLKCLHFLQQDEALIAQVELINIVGQPAGVRLYLFGYKQGVDFAELPKVQITINPAGHPSVLVNLEAVEDSGVTITNVGAQIILRVPLQLLGGSDLDHLFVAARAHLGAAIANDIAWHLLRFEVAAKSLSPLAE